MTTSPMQKPMHGLWKVDVNRKRHNVTFCLDIPAHREAYERFRAAGCKTDYIVYCINRAEGAVTKDDLAEALRSASLVSAAEPEQKQSVSDIPDDVLDILDGDW